MALEEVYATLIREMEGLPRAGKAKALFKFYAYLTGRTPPFAKIQKLLTDTGGKGGYVAKLLLLAVAYRPDGDYLDYCYGIIRRERDMKEPRLEDYPLVE